MGQRFSKHDTKVASDGQGTKVLPELNPPLRRPIAFITQCVVGGEMSWCLLGDAGELFAATELHNKSGIYFYAHHSGIDILSRH